MKDNSFSTNSSILSSTKRNTWLLLLWGMLKTYKWIPHRLSVFSKAISLPALASCRKYSWLASQCWPPSPSSFLQNFNFTHSHPPSSARPQAPEEARCTPTSAGDYCLIQASHGGPIAQYGLRQEHVIQLGLCNMRMSLLGSFWMRVLHS